MQSNGFYSCNEWETTVVAERGRHSYVVLALKALCSKLVIHVMICEDRIFAVNHKNCQKDRVFQ